MAGNKEPLSTGQIIDLQYQRRDGEADPERVREALRLFCEVVNKGEMPPVELLQYLRDGFQDFLGGMQIATALGLTRRRGRPRVDEFEQWARAAEVLRNRLAGQTYENAIFKASEDLGIGETVIKQAWEAHSTHGLVLFRLERYFDENLKQPFSAEEQARLIDIFQDRQAKVIAVLKNEDALGRNVVDGPEKTAD